MKAAVSHDPGVPSFEEFREPVAGPGESVVEVLAAGLNPVDLMISANEFSWRPPTFPAVPGVEGVGTVDGRRVYFGVAIPPFGALAERAVATNDLLFDLPDELDDGMAIAIGIPGLAAWLSLTWRAKMQPGERVLVLGATGVMGTIAVQAAKLLGAGQVVAAGRDEAALAVLRERGADATVNLSLHPDDLADAFREASGGGVDLVLDSLWGPPAIAALEATRTFGRLVQIGALAAEEITLSPWSFRMSCSEILGYTTVEVPPETQAAAYAAMAEHAAAGRIVVDVERFPLSEIASAWQLQSAGPRHKLVVVP